MCFSMAVIVAPSLYAQTNNPNQSQPYGDNPNIFRVLAHKTGEAVQNTAEKVGEVTEKGIQKIKPTLDSTIENTKTYTTEQAAIARDNTRQGIDTTVKKVEETKEKLMGKTTSNIPIESGRLSQSSTTPNINPNNYTMPAPQPIQQIPLNQAVQTPPQNNDSTEHEIKKQSLPIDNHVNNQNMPATDSSNSTNNNISSAKDSSDDETGVPR